ncbi:deoxyribodipyrimidine photo-lyase [Aliiroseovarius sediminis]|uniref:cryptochrome/photolyase family protein n=1 Tax=Aliiroseovarius sediminis TaxID=2925839 RepID=UPI001F598BB2|nr:deoxyribodipyrimidine photo-lyase [Aliiroseovarius sediminis]MCI2395815.1 DNA photolyase family protein [Aliiroseovarius sediminis]
MTKAQASNAILLFRDDLRVSDHHALCAAVKAGHRLTCAFIHDPDAPYPPGGARKWWLHHALAALADKLAALGGSLVLRQGATADMLADLRDETGACDVYWSRRYTPDEVEADTNLKADLTSQGCTVHSHPGRYLLEPWQVSTKAGTPFRVFSPFWRASREQIRAAGLGDPLPVPDGIAFADDAPSESLDDLDLLPTAPNWAKGFEPLWQPGEDGAMARLDDFLDGGADGYAKGRDFPAEPHTSRLSPYLQSGNISPRQVWAAVDRAEHLGQMSGRDAEKFRAELGWRDFAAYLLFHNRDFEDTEFQPKFRDFPWRYDKDDLAAWQQGQTGYPIVDAGMRELWQTGHMHNRVRMVVASFLVKHLRLDWRAGRDWFWDTLVDGDLASNAASWQWVAGCGADAAPYFRVFNPMTQAEKFDPDGDYIRTYVPEIADLPDRHLAAPWKAPDDVLDKAGVKIGKTYPAPMVDHANARRAALDAFENLPSPDEIDG